MHEQWTTVIVAPTLEIAQSDDYIDPWPGDEVRIVAGARRLHQLEGRRYERVAVREPLFFTADQLRFIRNVALGNWCHIPHPKPAGYFAISTKVSA